MNQNTVKSTGKSLKDSNYTVLRTLIENLDPAKYPNRYVNIYYVDTVNKG